MGRPRGYRDDEVLDRALAVFWQRGYAGTSVQDLVDATGLSRASLYGGFGDKEQLLRRVLARYGERLLPAMRALSESASAREGFRRFFDAWLGTSCGSGARGCLLLQAANEPEPRPAIVDQTLRESSQATDRAFRAALRRGVKSGELAPDLDIAATARFLGVLMQGIAASSRAGTSAAELRAATLQGLSILSRAPSESPALPSASKAH